MKIFFDTEFTGLHKGTTLISIGCVSEDGRTFYAEFTDYNKSQVTDWIDANVVQNLKFNNKSGNFANYEFVRKYVRKYPNEERPQSLLSQYSVELKGDTATIQYELGCWLNQFDEVLFVSDCSHYDFVLLTDIFGTAFDLPDHVCPACHDINQDIAKYYEITEHEAFDVCRENIVNMGNDMQGKHNALHDAIVIKEIYNIVS